MPESMPRPPRFYTVPAGAKPGVCRAAHCRKDIYFVDSTKTPGTKVPIDCNVEGLDECKPPTAIEEGKGIIHFITCSNPQQFHRPRPPTREHQDQREIAVDHKAPACIHCGCTPQKPCTINREELTFLALVALMKRLEIERLEDVPLVISCTWHQLEPVPVCSTALCVAKLEEMPLRYRVPPKTPVEAAS